MEYWTQRLDYPGRKLSRFPRRADGRIRGRIQHSGVENYQPSSRPIDAVASRDSFYSVVASSVLLADEIAIWDIGILVYREASDFERHPPDGTFETEIWLGVDPYPYFERYSKLDRIPPLIYSWRVDSILRQTAPWIEQMEEDGPYKGRVVRTRDVTRQGYEEVPTPTHGQMTGHLRITSFNASSCPSRQSEIVPRRLELSRATQSRRSRAHSTQRAASDSDRVTYLQIDSENCWTGIEEMKQRYAVIFERAENNWSAYVPDLPGCITTGATLEDAEQNIREAIQGHIETLREFGEPVPEPTSVAREVELSRR